MLSAVDAHVTDSLVSRWVDGREGKKVVPAATDRSVATERGKKIEFHRGKPLMQYWGKCASITWPLFISVHWKAIKCNYCFAAWATVFLTLYFFLPFFRSPSVSSSSSCNLGHGFPVIHKSGWLALSLPVRERKHTQQWTKWMEEWEKRWAKLPFFFSLSLSLSLPLDTLCVTFTYTIGETPDFLSVNVQVNSFFLSFSPSFFIRHSLHLWSEGRARNFSSVKMTLNGRERERGNKLPHRKSHFCQETHIRIHTER